jgi:excisionase family DNA binding protein
MPSFLTTREAADLLKVSEKTIQRARSSGKLPFQKLGVNGVRFRREHVEALLSDGTPSAAPAKSWTATRITRDSDELPEQLRRQPSRRAEAA